MAQSVVYGNNECEARKNYTFISARLYPVGIPLSGGHEGLYPFLACDARALGDRDRPVVSPRV